MSVKKAERRAVQASRDLQPGELPYLPHSNTKNLLERDYGFRTIQELLAQGGVCRTLIYTEC